MFCVECGKETTEDLREGMCSECFLVKNPLVEIGPTVDLEVCVHCHARKRGEIWLTGSEAVEPIVEDAVREAVRWDKRAEQPRLDIQVISEDERNFTVKLVASGVALDVPFERNLATRSRLKNATCLRCSRIQGGYYESIVQLRATRRDLSVEEKRAIRQVASRFIERIVTDGDRNAFVLRDLEEHGGLDIYLGTTNAGRMLAKSLANEYGGRTTEHAKVVGQKDGLDLYRLTFAVRFPEYRVGDHVVLQDEALEVTSIGTKAITLEHPVTRARRHVERDVLDRALVLFRADARQAVVVSQSQEELQLLDPWTYKTVSVLRPSHAATIGETVDVIRHEGELIVLRPA